MAIKGKGLGKGLDTLIPSEYVPAKKPNSEDVTFKDTAKEFNLPSVDNLNVCPVESKFLGWTSTQESKNVEYKNEESY